MPKAQPLLLDLFPNAAVAYSLRKLRTAYSGSAIRVRRSSDNTEQNIGFVGNNLDTTSLLAFCGAGNGFVTTWYDQSGNSRNATQSNALEQAIIVTGGSLEVDSIGKPTTVWSSSFYSIPSFSSAQPLLQSVVINKMTGTVNGLATTSASSPCALFWDTSSNLRTTLNSAFTHSNLNVTGRFNILTSRVSGVVFARRNGVELISSSNSGSANFNNWGRQVSIRTTGQYQELVYWGQDYNGVRIEIETNINSHYNIY